MYSNSTCKGDLPQKYSGPAFVDTYNKLNEDGRSYLTRNKHIHIILYLPQVFMWSERLKTF